MMKIIENYLFSDCEKGQNVGLLVLRMGIAYLMVTNHGWSKLTGGPERWAGLGEFGMPHLGVTFFFTFFGFMAAFSESIGALCIGLGLFFRPAAFLLMTTMLVGANIHIMTGKGNPELALVYALSSGALLLMGSGEFSLDKKLFTSNQINSSAKDIHG